MRKLAEEFPHAKGYATKERAQAKLDKHADAIHERSLTATVERADGRWLAIVIITRDDQIVNIPYLTGNGICLIN